MPFGLSKRRRNQRRVVVSSPNHYPPAEKYCGMILRLNIDCNACCRKLRRIVLNIKEIEKHMIEKEQRRLLVVGRFVPSDVAIHIKKKMNRRVEILEIQEIGGSETSERDQTDTDGPAAGNNNPPPPYPMVVYPGQVPPSSCHLTMPPAFCKSSYSPTMEIVQVWDDDCHYCVCVTEEEDELLPNDDDITGLEGPSWESNNYLDYY
ncbi:hypothetical protein QN277_003927 [Acacia crassicarpa]|uniref:HMA domain-containing protein n=1 Tax=Acacia crassicarpa TaxID=499986 RepID=A0AAE1J2L4_9FABA|nr:hypothetical protein QN277_003927 [Acacia crassicarpa]